MCFMDEEIEGQKITGEQRKGILRHRVTFLLFFGTGGREEETYRITCRLCRSMLQVTKVGYYCHLLYAHKLINDKIALPEYRKFGLGHNHLLPIYRDRNGIGNGEIRAPSPPPFTLMPWLDCPRCSF